MNEKHFVCCTDDNYAPYCGCMLLSLLRNGNCSNSAIHILIECLSQDNIEKISNIVKENGGNVEFHNVDGEILTDAKFRKKNPLSKAAYFRVLLSSVLSQDVKTVMYLDCDMIIVGDISYIFDINISKYALAAVKDLIEEPRCEEHRFQFPLGYNDVYFNSGFMYINLQYWREHNSETELIKFAKKERHVFFHDQDALNYVFKGKWLMLPPDTCYFNGCLYEQISFSRKRDFVDYKSNYKVIHYASSEKPWHKSIYYPNKKEFNDFLCQTPWKGCYLSVSFKRQIKAAFRFSFVSIRNVIYQSPAIIRLLSDSIVFLIFMASLGRIPYYKWKHL